MEKQANSLSSANNIEWGFMIRLIHPKCRRRPEGQPLLPAPRAAAAPARAGSSTASAGSSDPLPQPGGTLLTSAQTTRVRHEAAPKGFRGQHVTPTALWCGH